MTLPAARSILLNGLVPGGSSRLALLRGLVPISAEPPPLGAVSIFPAGRAVPRVKRRRDTDDDVLLFLLRR